jgi:NAD(P)H-dependent flavin oxidoreductase YrpB (nitropropane dioxygenase family)
MKTIKTRVSEMLGIKYPILAAPMGYISRAELVSAVSNAGGLGILVSMTFPTIEDLREEIKKTKSMTDKPFAVNVTLMPTMRKVNYEDYFATAIEEGVRIVETSGRSPEPYMKMLKDAKVITMHRATRTKDIITAERVGADIGIILGFEAAGHPGVEDVTSMVRVPITVDAVKIPVVAAGGIADARGVVAALALGAEGVLMGTRFMVSKEAPIHPKLKEWLLNRKEVDTMLIQRSIRNEHRVLRTDYTLKILEMEQRGSTLEELLPLISGRLTEAAYVSGDMSNCTISMGQAVGLLHEIPSVKEIIESIVIGADIIMERLDKTGLSKNN